MKTILSLSALLITLTLTAQSNTATWYLNNTSGNGIQSPTSVASGNYSTAMGYNTIADGLTSTAMGKNTIASGDYSTVMGGFTKASEQYSTAMGYQTTASAPRAVAMGSGTLASGDSSTAMGIDTKASGGSSTATGSLTEASGTFSTAMGASTTASGDYSTTMGSQTTSSGFISTAMGAQTTSSGASSTAMGDSTTASGERSTSLGYKTTASDRSSLVVGQYNLLGSTVTNSATQFSTDNTAFVIGNGVNLDNRSDALTVLFDGTTTIAGDLNLNSDARLKANIISLGSTLAKLLQIDGKTYTMKKDENKKQKIGVLAQDIEKVFPELVSESNGVKSVNYQGLVPVLINALKEQDNKMNEQEARIERLEKLLLNS